MYKIDRVYDNVYKVIMPLTGNPLKYLNIYVLKDGDKSLVIDTGFNNEEIVNYTKDYIDKLDIDLSKTILYLTHLHSDHIGLAPFFEKGGATIYMGDVDANLMRNFKTGEFLGQWDKIMEYAHIEGLDKDGLKVTDHPGYKYRPTEHFNYISKNPTDKFSFGEFNFEVMDLSGHTPGMTGLYDKEKGILFSADHILSEITPNITFWGFDVGDSLGTYFKNLEKVRNLNLKHLFSAHRHLIDDVQKRIDELLKHHKLRLDECLKALDYKGVTVREVTSKMHWDISSKDFESFPKGQKFFACGEAHAHLEHLRAKGLCDYKEEDGVLYYFKK